MIIQERDYQIEAEKAVFDYWEDGGENPLVEMATGTGKSVVIARLNRRLLTDYEGLRVLMLTHVRELVSQNCQALIRYWPSAPVGINSAGLGRRDMHSQILFASIQSVYKIADQLGPRDVVMVDECDLIPRDGEGMYRTLIEKLRIERPEVRVCGFTATPYRLDSGLLTEGDEGRLFTDTVYSYGLAKAVEDGWLAPLRAKAMKNEIDVKGVKKAGGEFVSGALEDAADKDDVVQGACDEMVREGKDRKAWLAFCSGIKHAGHVCEALRERGISAACVTSKTPSGERDSIFEGFKRKSIRCLTGMNVFTTGFDNPFVDMIGMLRPTLSTRLYVQSLGRGTRTVFPHGFDPNSATRDERVQAIAGSSKPDCLVLDFSGNVRRHGPVDLVVVAPAKKKDGEKPGRTDPDTVRAKICPQCQEYNSISALTCIECGFEWPLPEPKHSAVAEVIPVMSRDVKNNWIPVLDLKLDRHRKFGDGPDSLVALFECAKGQSYRQWICFEHKGIAREKADFWWLTLGGKRSPPKDINEALARAVELHMPIAITIIKDDKWWRVSGIRAERPDGSHIEIDQSSYRVRVLV